MHDDTFPGRLDEGVETHPLDEGLHEEAHGVACCSDDVNGSLVASGPQVDAVHLQYAIPSLQAHRGSASSVQVVYTSRFVRWNDNVFFPVIFVSVIIESISFADRPLTDKLVGSYPI